MPDEEQRPLDVLLWGVYDLGKPRARILRAAVARSGARVREIHADVWSGAEDKSVLSRAEAARRALRWIAAYPRLILRFLRAPKPDLALVPYPGQLDVLILRPFAALRGVPVVWDAFISLHDTMVDDRKMLAPRSLAARALLRLERCAIRTARRVVLDTEAHAALFREIGGVPAARVTSVFVGAEAEAFPLAAPRAPGARATVLFYGQFIPLHGIETIVAAARMAAGRPIDWVVIGTGQMAPRIRADIETDPPGALTWIDWVPYPELARRIAEADLCLGVFGTGAKAGRVIPNKVFQVLSAGRPLVTRDGPGMRELIPDGAPGVALVPPGDPAALLEAVERLLAEAPHPPDLHADLRARFSPDALAARWDAILREAIMGEAIMGEAIMGGEDPRGAALNEADPNGTARNRTPPDRTARNAPAPSVAARPGEGGR